MKGVSHLSSYSDLDSSLESEGSSYPVFLDAAALNYL